MRGHAQGGDSVLRESFIAKAVELAFSGNAGQLLVELREIERPLQIVAEPRAAACGSCRRPRPELRSPLLLRAANACALCGPARYCCHSAGS